MEITFSKFLTGLRKNYNTQYNLNLEITFKSMYKKYEVSKNVPYSAKTPLILLKSAFIS